MNIKIILFFFFGLLGVFSNVFAGPLCALAPAGHNRMADQQPSAFAAKQMRAVDNVLCNRFGCPRFRFLQNSTLQNAMATLDQSGNTIRYNSRFMRNTMQSYGSLAAIGVLAHELGHIIDFNQNRSQIPQAQREATADRYAGCAFALAGHPESDLMGLAQSLHAMGSSPGYPTSSQRVGLIREGYNQCR